MMVSTAQLLEALPRAIARDWAVREVRTVQCDSRRVAPGDLFVAIPGVAVDGHSFVPAALDAGAVAVVVERDLPELARFPTVVVPNAREALAYLHAAMNGFPARKLVVVGVTGTDGKTTTTRLIASILQAAGKPVGRIDSVSASIGATEVDTGFHTTTPDAPEIQRYLAQMVAAGMEYAVIESTSHGLAQHRVTACEYDVAVFTNITREHLDFHGTYEAYRDAKAMLLHALNTAVRKPGVAKAAVVNADDSSYTYLRAIEVERRLAYSLGGATEVVADAVESSPAGLRMDVRAPGFAGELTSPLVGRYNAHNILAAVGAACALGIGGEAIGAGVAAVRGVPGRMERIDCGQAYTAIVDFAHTPNALDQALRTARELAARDVIVVFGCAGLRDRGKRPQMGEVAGRLADKVIITAEDPRTEPLEAIMAEIAEGCLRAGASEGRGFWRIGDRRQAIARALGMARPGDVVIVTGKGHESSMCFGTTEFPWSDRETIVGLLQS